MTDLDIAMRRIWQLTRQRDELKKQRDDLVEACENILRAGMRLNKWNRDHLKLVLAQIYEEGRA